jgi:glyoxylase-like metal-dependent hydrolase (beta-lactamase superfamily II)
MTRLPATSHTACAVLVALVVVLRAVSPAAQGGRGAQAPKVARIEQVRDNLYWITEGTGAPGASNLAVLVADTEVVLVDTKNPGWGNEIHRLIGTVTEKPVRTIVNTHVHRDHTGSNPEFPERTEFVVHENTRANLLKEVCEPIANCGFLAPDRRAFVPRKTFKDRMTLGAGRNRIELYNFGPAHTNGDAIVVFPAQRAAHLGDLFARKSLPNIMATDGGEILGHLHTLNQALATIQNVDTIITGHATALFSWTDFQEFVQMNRDFVDAAQGGVRARKRAEDVAAEIVATLKRKYPTYEFAPAKARENVSLVYDEVYRSGHYLH